MAGMMSSDDSGRRADNSVRDAKGSQLGWRAWDGEDMDKKEAKALIIRVGCTGECG